MYFFRAFLALSASIFMSQTLNAAPALQLRDVEYLRVGESSLRFDGVVPDSISPMPAAIIVHGGGWVRGDRRANVEPLFKPLQDAGFAWFSISYSLASSPLQIGSAASDVEAAVRFIRSHALEYNIDPSRIALIGESAGGQLAAMAALGPSVGKHIKAVVAFYTPTDLVSLAKTSTLIPEGIRSQLKGSPFETIIMSRLAQLSPISAMTKDMPPFLFIHGDSDRVVPIEQSRLMLSRMEALGVDCKMLTVPGGGHGIRWWESSSTSADLYKTEMVKWLQAHLVKPSLKN